MLLRRSGPLALQPGNLFLKEAALEILYDDGPFRGRLVEISLQPSIVKARGAARAVCMRSPTSHQNVNRAPTLKNRIAPADATAVVTLPKLVLVGSVFGLL